MEDRYRSDSYLYSPGRYQASGIIRHNPIFDDDISGKTMPFPKPNQMDIYNNQTVAQFEEDARSGRSHSVRRRSLQNSSTLLEENSNRDKKKKTASSILRSFASTTSLQGPPFIERAGFWFSRTAWSVILIGAIVALAVHLYLLCSQFFSFQTSTKITLGYKSLEFPTVTICNINPIRASQFDEVLPEFQEFLKIIKPQKNVNNQFEVGNLNKTGSLSGPPKPVKRPPPLGSGVPEIAPSGRNKVGSTGRDKRLVDRPHIKLNATRVPSHEENDEEYGGDGEIQSSVQIQRLFQSYLSNEDSYTRYNIGHQPETFIVSCAFNGRKCSFENFSVSALSVTYQNCFSFNSVETRKTPYKEFRSGAPYGLDLVLYLERHEHAPGLAQGSGVRFDIHPFNTLAFTLENGLSAPPGFESQIGVKMVNITRLSRPYGKCIKGGQFSKLFGRKYTIEGCLNTCTPRMVHSKCKCYIKEYADYYPKSVLNGSRPCDYDDADDYRCVKKWSGNATLETLECSKECSQACNEINYDMLISQHEWPDASLYSELVNSVCEYDEWSCLKLQEEGDIVRALRKNFVRLRIYYRDLNFENIEEVADYGETQFLSDIGGTVGLWLGASVITVCELFDLIVQLIHFGCAKTRRQKEMNHKALSNDKMAGHNSRPGSLPSHYSRNNNQSDRNYVTRY